LVVVAVAIADDRPTRTTRSESRYSTSIHFRQEEEVLLPVLARYGGEPDQESVVSMLAQHARIRGLIMGLSDEMTGKGVRPETLLRLTRVQIRSTREALSV
jgi:hypothetical protein